MDSLEKYRSQNWQIDLPLGWVAEQEDEVVILYHPDQAGTLSISSTLEEAEISDEYVEGLLAEHIDAGAELIDVEYNIFSGVSCCYDDEEEFWCEWYLWNERLLIFITYNCPLDEEGKQEDVVESMLETLTPRTPRQ